MHIRLFFLLMGLVGSVSAQRFRQSYQNADDPAIWVRDNFAALRAASADSARYYTSRAIALAESRGEEALTAKLYQLRGIAHFQLGNYERELADHQRALRLAERVGDEGLQGEILLELCLTSNRQNDLDAAIAYGQRAIQLCEAADQRDCLAAAKRNLGRSYLKQDERERAVPLLRESLALRREMNDSVGIPYGLNDMSQLAMAAEDYAAAVAYLEESSRIRRAIGDTAGLAVDLNNVGEIYLAKNELAAARRSLERSLVLSRRVKYTALQQHTLGLLGDIYERQQDYAAAYANLQESAALRDSLYGVEKARAIGELEVQYETEANQRTIAMQAAELRAQRLVAVAVVLGLLLLGSVLYYRFFRRRKYEREIARLNLQRKLHQERERISRDLHDSVGANLTRIITDLDLLALPTSGVAPRAVERIDDTRDFTQQTIHLLRDTIWAMNKDSFTTSEFAGKVESFLRHYLGDRIAWRVEREIERERRLNSSEVLNLLRILQEATQNMLKHAQANEFVLKIASTADKLSMRMRDNGKGMHLDDAPTRHHYGLENMRQRAQEMGGTLTFRTAPGEGMEVEVGGIG